MRLKPRARLRLYASLALLLALLLPTLSLAQQQQRKGVKPSPVAQKKEAERARRLQAITLLLETADKARTFDDLFYRARIQMLAADALWPHEAAQARVVFRRAWEAAVASDKADMEEAAGATGALPGAALKMTEARDEVLAKAAQRDTRLAEVFLRDLLSDKDEKSPSANESSRSTAWRDLSASGARRLALAYELLEAGETRRAVEITAPLFNEGVSAALIAFMMRLRSQSVSEADALYLRLLERAAADPRTDANAVLLLSTPIISPGLLVVVDEFGSLQFRVLTPQPQATDIPLSMSMPKAQTFFYKLAATVLSRPLPPRETLSMQELVARFYATGRLLPSMEHVSQPHSVDVPVLRARHSELFNELEASRREQVSSQFTLERLTPAGYVDPLRSQTDQLSQASDPAERATLTLSIVKTAVRNKFWDRARRAAAEIEDAGRRQAALTFIQVHQIKDILFAYQDEKDDDFESVAKFVREADVPPFARAWGLAQTAVIAARKREARASRSVSELINEADAQAGRVAAGTPERVAAYGVITTVAARLDAVRAWELLREVVKAANAVEDFTGDDVSLDWSAGADAVSETEDIFHVEAEVFRLDGIFATMAHLDFDKALAEARALDGEVPRAFAMIAIAKSRIPEPGSKSQRDKP